MKRIILVIVMLFFTTLFFSQKKEITSKKEYLIKRKTYIDSLKKIDFLSRKYKYLDKDFKLNIDSTTFNNAVQKHKFYKETIKKYEDSLSVILMLELKNSHALRISKFKITYKWERIGYYIWESTEKAKEIGESQGFLHPYRFLEFLKKDSINTPFKIKLIKNLKNKLEKQLDKEIKITNYNDFFKLTFKESEQRKKDMEAYFRKKGLKNHKH